MTQAKSKKSGKGLKIRGNRKMGVVAGVGFEPTTFYSKMALSQNVLMRKAEIVSDFNCMYNGESDKTLMENRK